MKNRDVNSKVVAAKMLAAIEKHRLELSSKQLTPAEARRLETLNKLFKK